MDDAGRKLTSHEGSKIKSYTMSFKQIVAKFSKGNSINLASLKFNLDCKRIGEWVNNINEISTKKSTRKRHDRGGCKLVIIRVVS